MNVEKQIGSPIFIHSLFRSGSTYLFNAFRRSAGGYWCYQEPENELLISLNDEPEKLLQSGEETANALRHPLLDKPYFWEFYELRDELQGLFKKSFSYDNYFVAENQELAWDEKKYFETLIERAKGRPLLQLCRSSGRSGALKKAFGGVHIHLWRESRSQWWSIKINNYFDAAIQLIYNAAELPAVLLQAKHHAGITGIHNDNISNEFRMAQQRPLDPRSSYFAFYALWLFSFFENEKHADISISIDSIGSRQGYQQDVLKAFSQYHISDVDLADCDMPLINLSEQEKGLFFDVECQVAELFLAAGYDGKAIERIEIYKESVRNDKKTAVGEKSMAVRARKIAWWSLDEVAKAYGALVSYQERLGEKVSETSAKVVELDELAKSKLMEADALQEQNSAAEELISQLNRELRELRATFQQQVSTSRARIHELQQRANGLLAEKNALLNSMSWRVTKPIRGCKETLDWWTDYLLRKVKPVLVPMVISAIRVTVGRPNLRKWILKHLSRNPRLLAYARRFVDHHGILAAAPAHFSHPQDEGESHDNQLGYLTPKAYAVYQDLKQTVDHRERH